MNVSALVEVTMAQFQSHITTHGFGPDKPPFEPDGDELNRLLAQHSWEPDERLR